MKSEDRIACQAGCRTRADRAGRRQPVYARLPARICRACERRLETWLAGDPATGVRDIVEMWERLPDVISPGSVDTGPDTRRSKRIHSPAPLRPLVLDLLDGRHGVRFGVALAAMVNGGPPGLGAYRSPNRRGVTGLMESWASWVRDLRNLTPPRIASIYTEVNLLYRERGWIAEQPWVAFRMPGGSVEGFYPEMRRLHGELCDAVGDYRPRAVAKCWIEVRPGVECRGPILPNQDDDGVHCPRCGHRWPYNQLRHLGLVIKTSTGAAP